VHLRTKFVTGQDSEPLPRDYMGVRIEPHATYTYALNGNEWSGSNFGPFVTGKNTRYTLHTGDRAGPEVVSFRLPWGGGIPDSIVTRTLVVRHIATPFTDEGKVSETLCLIVSRIPDDKQSPKTSNSECDTLSEPFRNKIVSQLRWKVSEITMGTNTAMKKLINFCSISI
jgi:hypothetical protein